MMLDLNTKDLKKMSRGDYFVKEVNKKLLSSIELSSFSNMIFDIFKSSVRSVG